LGEGLRPRQEKLGENCFRDTVDVVENSVVVETQHLPTQSFKHAGSPNVPQRLMLMDRAVELDHQPGVKTDKVRDEPVNGDLSTKLEAAQPARPKNRPEFLLSPRRSPP